MTEQRGKGIMKSMLISGVMTLHYPDSFHEMSRQELADAQFLNDEKGMCISDPDSHILISVGYQQINGFSALMLSGKDIAVKDEKIIGRRIRDLGYQREGFLRRKASGKTAEGFGYTYDKNGIRMYGEYLIIKNGRTLCYLYLYTRNELKENLFCFFGIFF